MSLERQTTFGWLVAVDIFLGGAGAGLFMASFIMHFLNKYEPVARVGAILGPTLVLIGILFLVADLGSKTAVYRLFSNVSSWMSRGTWILTVFIIFGLGYSLPSFSAFAWLPWSQTTTLGQIIGIVAAISSVLAVVYTGFLFGVVKRIPFWNTPASPILFLLSGLCTGIAILLLIAPFFAANLGPEIVTFIHTLAIAEIVLILIQLVVLGGYLDIAGHGGIAAIESIRLLKTQLFIGGVIIVGIIVPLGLLFYGVGVSNTSVLSWLAPITGVLLLIGGIFLRYAIVRGGVYLPLHSL